MKSVIVDDVQKEKGVHQLFWKKVKKKREQYKERSL